MSILLFIKSATVEIEPEDDTKITSDAACCSCQGSSSSIVRIAYR
jgi:hypothetical protein